jgi:hypothetical protein
MSCAEAVSKMLLTSMEAVAKSLSFVPCPSDVPESAQARFGFVGCRPKQNQLVVKSAA